MAALPRRRFPRRAASIAVVIAGLSIAALLTQGAVPAEGAIALDPIAACPLVKPAKVADPAELEGPPRAPFAASIPDSIAARVRMFERVWHDLPETTYLIVDERRPEIVHAEVACAGLSEGQCHDARREARESVRAALRAPGTALYAALVARYQAAPALLASAADHLHTIVGKREALLRSLRRAAPYMATLEAIFVEEGVPPELARLAIVESRFRAEARSKAGAVGPYQMLDDTGRAFLRVDDVIDERKDVLVAGRAAARYLAKLHKRFGSWPLAITAYNAGEGRVSKLIKRHGTRDLGALVVQKTGDARFGYEARNYYAQVAASVRVADEVLATRAPQAVLVSTTVPVALSDVALCTGTTAAAILGHTPSLSLRATKNDKPLPRGVKLTLPARGSDTALPTS